MFGLFKNKKKELAKEIFGAFKPKILVAKTTGKWEKTSTFGDIFIEDDYLLGFFNTYLSIVCAKFGYSGQDSGLIMQDVYKLLDGTYSNVDKLEKLLRNFQVAKVSNNKDFVKGSDHAAMFFLVFTNDNNAHKFSKDPIFKEANKHFESGDFKKRNDWAKKVVPDMFADGDKMSEAPSNIVIAYRIFEKTFEERLNKTFKV